MQKSGFTLLEQINYLLKISTIYLRHLISTVVKSSGSEAKLSGFVTSALPPTNGAILGKLFNLILP